MNAHSVNASFYLQMRWNRWETPSSLCCYDFDDLRNAEKIFMCAEERP